jgi:RHS repeat-associated protein
MTQGGNVYRVKDISSGYVYATYSNYNALGQVGRIDYGNGVNTIYQYYPDNNRLYSITSNSASAGGLMNISYYYDNVGNITQITDYMDSTKTRTFVYDELDRLIQADSVSYGGTITYQYDKIGNMTYNSRYGSYSYDDPAHVHAVTQAGSDTYSYDANGNMISGAGRTFSYDYDNRATSIVKEGAATISVYDAYGNRVKKVTPDSTTIYIGKLYECTNGICSKYIFAGDQRIAKVESAETYFYHTDHLGSSNIITDSTGYAVQDIYYYPYGEIKTNTGSDIARHKFTGQEWDAEAGLYYYGARYYDPKLGRFISADTIVPDPINPQALNRYSYVLNNPLIYTDPTGHIFGIDDLIVAVVIGAVIGGTSAGIQSDWDMEAVLKGAVIGAVSGAVGGVVGGYVGGVMSSAGYSATVSSVVGGAAGGAAAGATSAALTGGDITQGALIGLVAGGIGGYIGTINFNSRMLE